MINQFSPKVSQVLAFSREEATRLASRSVGPEHLLLGIMRGRNEEIMALFTRLNVNLTSVKTELEDRVRQEDIMQPLRTHELVLNEKASNILKLAVLEARIQRTQTVDVQHLLLAILHDQVNNGAKEILEFNNMNYEDTLTYLQAGRKTTTNGMGLTDEDYEEDNEQTSSGNTGNKANKTATSATSTKNGDGKTPVIDKFSFDFTQAARDGKLDPVVGREKEIMRLSEILCRRKKNNPVLIGEPGVGKSAIVEGLAQRIINHKTSPVLFNKRLVSLDLTGLIAGTKYRGQFEERIKALIKELENNPDIIVFIDEIHTMIGAGAAEGSGDVANIMKPALARGTIQCIGATTLNEYRNSIEKDGALERRFQKIIVEQNTAEETLLILHNIKERYEQHHKVTYTEEAIKACVSLTERYVSDRFFPDKAIDALDEVGAKVHLRNADVPPAIVEKEKELVQIKHRKQTAVSNQNFELAASYRDKQSQLEQELQQMQLAWTTGESDERAKVTDTEVAEVVSQMTGVPIQRIAESEGARLRNMEKELKRQVVAQDAAVTKVVKAIQRNRIGLKAANHPIGVFMFLGPTGVGKTHLAKKIAELLFGSTDALVREDMNEYAERWDISRLIGSSPGYVGYDEGGQLTEKVRRKPYCVVLLDEIEKAHQNVTNLLLQMLDEGKLTDASGHDIDFRNTIIIMTSNAGTRQLKEFGRGVGFNAGGSLGLSVDDKDKEYARSVIQKSLSKQFAPEFLNRIDEIITFDQLDLEAIKQIIDLELEDLYKRINAMGYSLKIDDKAKEYVATKGYDVQFGARPLKRSIQTYIEDEVCERILSEEIKPGDTINVTLNESGDKLIFN